MNTPERLQQLEALGEPGQWAVEEILRLTLETVRLKQRVEELQTLNAGGTSGGTGARGSSLGRALPAPGKGAQSPARPAGTKSRPPGILPAQARTH